MIPDTLWRKMNFFIVNEGFKAVGFCATDRGTIYIAEKPVPEGWAVRWFTRDPLNEALPDGKRRVMTSEFIARPYTTPEEREHAAIQSAEEALEDNARFIDIMKKKDFDATAQ